jgi:predicted permease
MFVNYFKTAIRHLRKNYVHSFLNIIGLATGIACAALIFLWVEDECGYDQFNTKKDRLYLSMVNEHYESGIFTHASSPGVMGPAIQAAIPGIANTCRITESDRVLLLSNGDKSIYAGGRYAEKSLFSMFTLPFVQGNAAGAFSQLHSLVITETTARKLFGQTNVVGKIVRLNQQQDYVITGVLKDLPRNSSLQFEWLAPFDVYYQQSPWAQKWENNCLTTYVELEPGANLENVNKQLYNFVQQKAPTSLGHIFLFNMNKWHLYNRFENGRFTGGGRIEYVRLFSVIAWIILLIACINFMNLATAASEKRAREVGVRKVLGAAKKRLVSQFMGEAFLLALLSAFIAVFLLYLVLPGFNMLVQKQLSLRLSYPVHAGALLLIALVCGLVSGSYPAFYLSSFKPMLVLKGLKQKAGGAALVRKGMVVVQFTVSIVLIISTIIIYRQIQHIKSRDLGFDKNNLVEMEVQGNMAVRFPVIKQDLMNTGLVENVALSDHGTIYGGNNTSNISWPGRTSGDVLISWRNVSPEFFSTSGMQLVEGRGLVPADSLADKTPVVANVVVTESLARMMGKGSAVGKTLFDAHDTLLHATVVGVVKDYVYGNMYGKPDPVVFFCIPPRYATLLYVRVKPHRDVPHLMDQLEAAMKKDNPGYPLRYRFVDEQFNSMFENENLISKLSRLFAALAILISCLGLFGLAAFTAERRTKEIGIRKVLGASVAGIAGLLSKDFIRLVLIAALISFPLAWWIMHNWLQNYAYHVSISWWIFIAAAVLAALVALVTISWQAIRAARANPVKSLRTE